MNANARLIADAGTVLHETGKSPSELAAEVERLERAGAAAFEAMRKSQAEVERLTTQVESLTVEVEEESHIQGRMAQLLAGAIVAIRGPEPELTRWGYHDLPERVRDVVAQRDVLLAASNRVTAAFRALGVADGVARNMQARNGCERALVALDAAIHQCEGAKA